MYQVVIKTSVLCLLFAFLWQLSACKKEGRLPDGAQLKFEVDTLRFDTVFTDMGSATRKFKVYNPHNSPIIVSSIRLAGGSNSDFHLNIDGLNTISAENVEIPAKDSIYIFANVRIDPNNGDALRTDSILFQFNNGEQKVQLEAYGWNAIYVGQRGYLTRYTDTQITLTADTPYVFFGVVAFDSNSVLTIPAGAQIFMFGGPSTRPGDRATLYIGDNSTLKVNVGGDLNNPVEFKTHRLEWDYQELPFQHGGIYLSRGSINNQIHGCIIRNAVDGIIADSLANNSNPKLEIKNSMIYNVDRSGILARQSSIVAENVVIANSNQFGVVGIRGGFYDFKHCSLVNYGVNPFVGRNEPLLSLRDFEIMYDNSGNQIGVITADVILDFSNCVVYGTKNEEIEVSRAFGSTATWNYSFNDCLLKLDTFSTGLNNCIINKNPYFEDVEAYLYRPDTAISPLVNGGTNIGVFFDIMGKARDTQPDIGAYEF